MTITCPSCKPVLTFPDDRIPKGRAVTAACPQCKGKIVIDASEAAPSPAAAPPAPAATPSAAAAPAGPREEPASYAERSQPTAPVCVADPSEREQVLAILKGEASLAHAARDAADALERTRSTPYDVVILQDGFGGDGNPVLAHLAELRLPRAGSCTRCL